MSIQLRYNEYYNLQEMFDNLYSRSEHNATKGVNLYDKIIKRENILLAYRTIKSNKGSKTKGTDNVTIEDYKIKSENDLVEEIREELKDFKPQTVKRVMIPKVNGEERPLGIPTMRDRIIQQMFKQVLEPICEAKFYNHSYGYRPNRSTRNALARCQHLVNKNNLHYVVDVDIKGFFDNVNHNKLIKQLYTIGVKDNRVLNIISKMLKSEIKGEGIQSKGVPQGGILSPLLSNVVLNELDQWVYTQWEGFKTDYEYVDQTKKIRAIKENSKLKEVYIVRYADDFKLFTRDYKTAIKMLKAVKRYLKDTLKLEVSNEKTKIRNLRKNSTDFVGYKIKAVKKKKYVAYTNVSDKNKLKIRKKMRSLIKDIQKNPDIKTVNKHNAYVISIKNYYKYTTHISRSFKELHYLISRTLYNRLKRVAKYGKVKNKSKLYKQYHDNDYKTYLIQGIPLHVLADIRFKLNVSFNQNINNYTEKGRILYKKLPKSVDAVVKDLLLRTNNNHSSVEYIDNRISKYTMQKGLCTVTGKFLNASDVHCHHIKPKRLNGNDSFNNLVIIDKIVHNLIHATNKQTVDGYLQELNLTGKQVEKVNKYRKKCNIFEL